MGHDSMKAQRIILLTLASVAIPALAIACTTKIHVALNSRLRPSAPGFTAVAASRQGSAHASQTVASGPSQNPAVVTTPIGTLTPPIQFTNLVHPGSSFTNNTRTNPEPAAAIRRAESTPVPAVTLGTRATSGETSVLFWIGIFIAACLFFPAAAPLAGRILAAVVNRTPSLAGLAGVVSVEAFDALIKAIERSKQNTRLDNDNHGPSHSSDLVAASVLNSWLLELDSNLARELDASHQRLVEARKKALLAKRTSDSP